MGLATRSSASMREFQIQGRHKEHEWAAQLCVLPVDADRGQSYSRIGRRCNHARRWRTPELHRSLTPSGNRARGTEVHPVDSVWTKGVSTQQQRTVSARSDVFAPVLHSHEPSVQPRELALVASAADPHVFQPLRFEGYISSGLQQCPESTCPIVAGSSKSSATEIGHIRHRQGAVLSGPGASRRRPGELRISPPLASVCLSAKLRYRRSRG